MTDLVPGAPLSPARAEAEAKGRPPPRQADDGKAGGNAQSGKRGRRNDPGDGGEEVAPGES